MQPDNPSSASTGSHTPEASGLHSLSATKWLSALKTVFSLDLRSIALFRVLLAGLLLWDLALRSQSLTAFYTDEGVLPRDLWLQVSNSLHWSLHAASGEPLWQTLLFCLSAVFAMGLLVGYQTRFMVIASFVLLASLVNRNPLILQGGDQLLVVMCFWAMFLPLNARWSLDAALQPERKNQPNAPRFQANQPQLYFSMATIAVILQVLYLYVFTALLKTGDAWTVRFDAAFYAVSLDQLATPIGIWAREFPTLLAIATVYVLAVEFIAPALVLAPFKWPSLRLIGLALLASLHVGFLLMMHIGLFPLIDFMALLLLLPSAVWLWLHKRYQASKRCQRIQRIRIYYDEDCGFCLKMCLVLREMLLNPEVPILTAQSNPAVFAIMQKHNSWVITDEHEQPHIHWHAMRLLFAQRWPFKPISWVMGIKPLMAAGNAVYGWIAINRGTMGNVTAWALPWRTIRLKPTLLGSVVAAYFLVAVTVLNITYLPGLSRYQPTFIEQSIRTVRLDQYWNMFAPYPLTATSFVQIPGKLRSGKAVNVYPATEVDPTWQPPVYLASTFNGYRWRKYLGNVASHKNNAVRKGYGSYLCNQYNKNTKPLASTQLATFEIWNVSLTTNTSGEPRNRTRKQLWRHWCFAEFKPD